MKYLLFAFFFFLACSTTRTAAVPVLDFDTVYIPRTVYDTIRVAIHDTIRTRDVIYDTLRTVDSFPVLRVDSVPIPVPVNFMDTGNIFGTIVVYPTDTGDDWPNLQAAINWQAQHPGVMIKTVVGDYQLSRPLISANIQGGDYGQVKLDIEGPVNARNTQKSTVFHYNAAGAFALGVQNCKGCTIKNINFIGQYEFPEYLNVLQIDTLLFSQWPDTVGGGSRTSPNAAICIDPFSDPGAYDGVRYKMYAGLEGYYLPGMSQGGSTAIDISGCQITSFVVGVMITPSMQANGEMINITGNRIDNCKVSVAWSQAQSKANTISDFMSWGNVQTILDGVDYGFPRGDGSTAPMVDVMNIAGYTHQLLHATAQSFPITMKRVYAEGLYKIGMVEAGIAGVHFDDWQIDFQNGIPGVPSPDFYYFGTNTTWTSCMLRLYNGLPSQRIVLNSLNNVFRDGSIGSPPVCATLNPSQPSPLFEHVTLYWNNGMLNRNDYDSLVYVGTIPMTIDKSTFTGYFLKPRFPVGLGDVLTTPTQFLDFPGQSSQVGPAGFVTRISGDTVFVGNVGQNVQSGQAIDIYDCKFKTQ